MYSVVFMTASKALNVTSCADCGQSWSTRAPTDWPTNSPTPKPPLATLRQILCINNAMPGGRDWIKPPWRHRPSGENSNVWRKTNCSLHLQRAILLRQRLPKIGYATGSRLKNLYVSSSYPSISQTRGYSFFFFLPPTEQKEFSWGRRITAAGWVELISRGRSWGEGGRDAIEVGTGWWVWQRG